MTHQINDAPDNLIPEGESTGTEYAADVLDYAEEVFEVGEDGNTREVYEHRFVVIPASELDEAEKMLDLFNTGIQDDTGHKPVMYQRTVTYGAWKRV